jgi:hypothetical protein
MHRNFLCACLLIAVSAHPASSAGAEPDRSELTPERLVEKTSSRLRQFFKLVASAKLKEERDCEKLLQRIDDWVKKNEPQMKKLHQAYEKFSPAQKARARKKGEALTSRIIEKYTDAVVRFDQCCPRHSHRLEELLSRLLLGSCPGHEHQEKDHREQSRSGQ